MGLCGSKNAEAQESKKIDDKLTADKAVADKEVKMLLLGTGESGKSTIVKQMKVMYQGGYSKEECDGFIAVIYGNTLQSMKVLVQACGTLGLEFTNDQIERVAVEVVDAASGEGLTPAVGAMIRQLWADSTIQAAYSRSSEFQLNDSASYYFKHIDRIIAPGYQPTNDDVLRSRVRTTGIVETQFTYGDLHFKLYDVGGQRNERKKWIHCFQDVTAVTFVVGISEYDQKLLEDVTQNRMTESILLFDEICNSRWFTETSMILFLNKTDLFKEKLEVRKIPLTIVFPEYDGGPNFEPALKFLREKFCSLNHSPQSKTIYAHATCATDTENVKKVFAAVKDIILQGKLRTSGFI